MSDIYVMQRANGDVFALDDHGRFRVPLFNSSSDALLARSRNFEMLLFKPVQLDGRLLKQLVPLGGAAEVDFLLVSDPLVNLDRGRLVQPAQLAVLIGSAVSASRDEKSSLEHASAQQQNATAAWEDEGGRYSKCA